MTKNHLATLLRALEQNILSILRPLDSARRDELLSGLATLLERTRRASPVELTELHREFVALFTRVRVTLPEPRVVRGHGLESFRPTEPAYRGTGPAALSQFTLNDRVDAIERLLRHANPTNPTKPPAPVTLYPDVRAPEQVQVDHVFTIEAQICATATTPQTTPLQATPGSDGRVHVRVLLIPCDGLQLRSPADAELSLTPGQDSHIVAFRVQAIRADHFRPEVCFIAGTATAKTTLEVLATADPPPSKSVQSTTSLTLATPSPEDLHLTIIRRPGANDGLHLQLRLHRGNNELAETTAVYSAAFVADLHAQLTKLGDTLTELARNTWAATLRLFGRSLADDLLKHLREPLQTARKPGTRLIIQSTEAELPLELCLLEIDNRKVFLGDHFAVSRTELGPPPSATFRPRPAVLVWDPIHPFDLTHEESGLERLARDVERSDSYDDIIQRLEGSQQIGTFHFSVHGTSESDKPGSARLLLNGGDLIARLLPRARPGRPTLLDRGLVFLNACRTGAAQSGLIRDGSLIDAFRRAGVAAVLAPLWSVDSRAAGQFAGNVYDALTEGKPLDEAVRHARTQLPHEPDRLAYVLHAAPDCRPEPTPP